MPSTVKLLSFNIQAGSQTRSYRDYLTRSYAHVLPTRKTTFGNLDRIAEAVAPFDIVGLQEADPGSLRSSFENQTRYLAEKAGFAYWSHQTNRQVGNIAGSANGLLCRHKPLDIIDHPLPSRIPGRGALFVRFGPELGGLLVVIAHLSLGVPARASQVRFLVDMLRDEPCVALMGDFNCSAQAAELAPLYDEAGLCCPPHAIATFPSWEPRRAIDLVLLSESIEEVRRWRLNEPLSDHLAIAAEIYCSPLP